MDVWTIVIKPLVEQRSLSMKEKAHYDKFEAFLEGRHLLASASPLYDSAKLLIDQGENPNQLVTMQHHNRDHWSFKPQTLAFWATLEIPKKAREAALSGLIEEYPGTE